MAERLANPKILGMLYNLADGVKSLDAMHNDEYAKAAADMYEKDQNGPLGSPGKISISIDK